MSSSSRKENEKPKLRQSHSPQASTSVSVSLSRQPNVPPVAQFIEQQPLPPPSVPPRRAGSMHTKVVQYPPPPGPPPTKPLQPSPPAYSVTHDDEIVSEDYREPEPVANSPLSSVPELVDASHEMGWTAIEPSWDGAPSREWPPQSNLGSATGKGDYSSWGDGVADGQWATLDSGDHWWDRARLASEPKPGSGVLPPGLAVRLHPTSKMPSSSEDQNVIWRVSVSPNVSHPVDEKLGDPAAKQPSTDQVLRAIPHPHALFREVDNAWVYYNFKQSLNLPMNMVLRPSHAEPRESSFSSPSSDDPQTLPSQEQRREWVNCLDAKPRDARMNRWDRAPQTKEFRTHHFHHYPKSVRGSTLDPPFTRSVNLSPSSLFAANAARRNIPEEAEVWLDVWACCQCHAHIICSGAKDDLGTIPGVISLRVMRSLVHDRQSNPVPGTHSVESVLFALETLARILENYLFGLNRSAIKVGKTLQNKVGWNDNVKQLFTDLGFEYAPYVPHAPTPISATFPPNVQDIASPSDQRPKQLPPSGPGLAQVGAPSVPQLQQSPPYIGKLVPPSSPDVSTVPRMLRAWVELTVRCAAWKQRYQQSLGDYPSSHKLWVSIENAGEDVSKQIGAHHTQRLTVESHSPGLLEYAYLRQVQCDPLSTPVYLTDLCEIREWARRVHHDASIASLDELIAKETSQKRWHLPDLEVARKRLGVSREFDSDLLNEAFKAKVEFIHQAVDAQKAKIGRDLLADEDVAMVQVELRELKEAYRIIAESTGKDLVYQAYLRAVSGVGYNQVLPPYVPPEMDIQTASKTLEVPLDWEDEMVVTMYGIRVADQPNEADRMKRALAAFAKARNSERLARLAETGLDDWQPEQTEGMQPDWPRGILQLGNTCYLNSLLQYFYTIKDLREAILATPELAVAEVISEEDMKKRRVGGRLVTRREVERSKKFVNLLKELFWQLEWSTDPAIRPALELAKLALVTSKDEEEDEEGRSDKTNATTSTSGTGETQMSGQSGSTLVDEPEAVKDVSLAMRDDEATPTAASVTSLPQGPSPSSVLGKRAAATSLTQRRRHSAMMDVDSERPEEVQILVEGPRRATIAADGDGDVAMASSQFSQLQEHYDGIVPPLNEKRTPPPLPPRNKTAAGDGGIMMFGKQHDVSECMDNCMFQIEAALGLEKSIPTGDDESLKPAETKRSIVKKLFYGKIRQRISPIPTSAPSTSAQPILRHTTSIHEKEDLFSQLLVNVADEGYDLYDGLSGQFDDIVEFGGHQARMETSLVDLPPLLQIQLQRVQFNRDTLEAYKSNAYVKFGESLFVDRFLTTVNPEKKSKSKEIESNLKACRERLSALAKQKGGPYDRAIKNTIDMFCKQTLLAIEVADMDLMNDLKAEADSLEDELQECRVKATSLKEELERLWQDDREVEYELCSVFIHRGASPAFGHYFFYARDLPNNPERFIKYNDQDVVAVGKSEVLADTTGSTANPYLLVFARKGSNAVHTINRTNAETLEMDTT
ncbi:ubiquitin-specific protease ubp2 [Tulasnella sp. 330]|nr:ubiquitin-specific protease ubp2 [Tulasnella sp. 330]